jgi:hypothetical protein
LVGEPLWISSKTCHLRVFICLQFLSVKKLAACEGMIRKWRTDFTENDEDDSDPEFEVEKIVDRRYNAKKVSKSLEINSFDQLAFRKKLSIKFDGRALMKVLILGNPVGSNNQFRFQLQ